MNREKLERVAKRLQYFVYGTVEIINTTPYPTITIKNREPELEIDLTMYPMLENNVDDIVESLIRKYYNRIADYFFKPRHEVYAEIAEEEKRNE